MCVFHIYLLYFLSRFSLADNSLQCSKSWMVTERKSGLVGMVKSRKFPYYFLNKKKTEKKLYY